VTADPLGSDRLSLNQATVKHLDLAQSVDLCVRHQIPAIGLWRDRVAEAGLRRSVFVIDAEGVLRWKHVTLVGLTFPKPETITAQLKALAA